MNNKVRLIGGYTLLFIESILLCLLVLCLIFNRTFLNKEYVLNKIKKADSYSTLFNSIKTEMSYYTEQSGFEDDILDDTFTLDEVTTEFNKLVNSIYDNTQVEIDSSNFKERLNKKIDDFIEKNNFKIVDESEIKGFVDKLSEIYENKIKLSGISNYVKSIINNFKSKINNYILIFSIAIVVLTAIDIFVFKRKELSVLFFFLTFVIIAVNLNIRSVIDFKHLFVYNQTVTDPVNLIVDDIFGIILWISVISFIVGIILSIIEKDEKNKK